MGCVTPGVLFGMCRVASPSSGMYGLGAGVERPSSSYAYGMRTGNNGITNTSNVTITSPGMHWTSRQDDVKSCLHGVSPTLQPGHGLT